MCVVSMVSDHYLDKWKERYWWEKTRPDYPYVPAPIPKWPYVPEVDLDKVSREEFNRVKQELEDLKQLLKRAQKYDIDHNEPECELDEKIEALKKIAKAFDVEIEIK
jgi:hypothetical protein